MTLHSSVSRCLRKVCPYKLTPHLVESAVESLIPQRIFYALCFRNYAANQRLQFIRAGNGFDDLVEIRDCRDFSLLDETLDCIRQEPPRYCALFYPRYSRLSCLQSDSQISLIHTSALPGLLQPFAQVFFGAVACVHRERI